MADAVTFTNVRDWLRAYVWALTAVPPVLKSLIDLPPGMVVVCRQASLPLESPTGRLLAFVVLLRRAYIKGDQGAGMGAVVRYILPPFRRLLGVLRNDREIQRLACDVIAAQGFNGIQRADMHAPVALTRQTRYLRRALWRHGLADLFRLERMCRQ